MTTRTLVITADLLQIWKDYQRLQNVHAVGKLYGVSGETIRARLTKAGYRLAKSAWSEADIKALKDYYEQADYRSFRIAVIAKQLGRSEDAISLKASRLGFADPKRSKTVSGLNGSETLELPWRRWVKFPHPRGMLGKTHTPEERANHSQKLRQRWEKDKAAGTGYMSEELRQLRSDNSSKASVRLGRGGYRYSRAHAGKRDDLGGIYFRSRWEANVARYLNLLIRIGQIWKWEYEADTFWFEVIKRGTRSYTPDFKIWDAPGTEAYYWEVKGWMDAKSVTRMHRMGKYYPSVRVEMIDQKRYLGIKQTAAALCPGWETEGRRIRITIAADGAKGRRP